MIDHATTLAIYGRHPGAETERSDAPQNERHHVQFERMDLSAGPDIIPANVAIDATLVERVRRTGCSIVRQRQRMPAT